MASLGDLMIRIGVETADAISGFNEIAKGLDGISSATERNFAALDRMGARFTEVGTMMSAAVTLPLLAIGAAAVKAGLDFDEASDHIRAFTGATGETLSGLESTFKSVFESLPNSAKDVSTAIADLNVRLGLTGPALEGMATQMLNLSRVAETSVGPLIQQTTRMFGDWSIATDEQAGKLDYLYRVMQGTGAKITELASVVVQFGAPMRALGFDFETATALLGRFEKEGVNIQTVMAGMKRAISNFAKDGLDGAAAWSALVDQIKKSTDAQAQKIAMDLVGQRAAVDFSRAVKENRYDVEQMVETYKKGTESINGAAEATLSFSDKFKRFSNEIETSLAPIGKVLLGLGEKALDWAKPLLKDIEDLATGFGKLEPSTQGWILAIAGMAAAAGPLLIVIGGMASGVAALAPVLASVTAGLLSMGTSFAATFPGIAAMSTGALVLTAGLVALGVAATAISLGGIVDDASRLGEVFKLVATDTNNAAAEALRFRSSAEDCVSEMPPLEKAVLDVSAVFQKARTAMKEVSWTDMLTPLGLVRQGFKDLVDTVEILTGKYPVMFNSATNGIDKLNKSSADLQKSQVDAAMAAGKLQEAMAGIGKVSKETQDQIDLLAKAHLKALADRAIAERDANDAMNKRYEEQATAVIKLYDKLRQLDDQYVVSQTNLLKSFDAGRVALEKFNEAATEPGGTFAVNINTMALALDQLPPKISAAIQQLLFLHNELKDNSFKDLIFSEEDADQQITRLEKSLLQARDVYQRHLTDLKGNLVVSEDEMAKIEIASAEKRIALYRQAGREVSDIAIEGLNELKNQYQIANMELGDAIKTLGITSTGEIQQRLKLVTAAYNLMAEDVKTTEQQMNQATLALMQEQTRTQIANGQALTESQKRTMAEILRITKEGHATLATQWDKFANEVGDSVTKALDTAAYNLITGKGSFKDVLVSMWDDIAKAMVKDFIHPATEAIGKFVATALADLLGGNGFAGLNRAVVSLGKSLASIFGIATDATKTVTSATAAGAGAAGSVAGAASGSIAGVVTAVSGVVDAISSIIQNIQLVKIEKTLSLIEVSTRKSWIVTGEQSDSMVETLHKMRNTLSFMSDRIGEIRPALFEPIASDLEQIVAELVKIGVTLTNVAFNSGSSVTIEANTLAQDKALAESAAVAQAASEASYLDAAAAHDAAINNGTSVVGNAVLTGTQVLVNSQIGLTGVLAGAVVGEGDGTIAGLGVVTDAVTEGSGVVAEAVALSRDEIEAKMSDMKQDFQGQFGELYDYTGNAYNDLKKQLIGKPIMNEKGELVLGPPSGTDAKSAFGTPGMTLFPPLPPWGSSTNTMAASKLPYTPSGTSLADYTGAHSVGGVTPTYTPPVDPAIAAAEAKKNEDERAANLAAAAKNYLNQGLVGPVPFSNAFAGLTDGWVDAVKGMSDSEMTAYFKAHPPTGAATPGGAAAKPTVSDPAWMSQLSNISAQLMTSQQQAANFAAPGGGIIPWSASDAALQAQILDLSQHPVTQQLDSDKGVSGGDLDAWIAAHPDLAQRNYIRSGQLSGITSGYLDNLVSVDAHMQQNRADHLTQYANANNSGWTINIYDPVLSDINRDADKLSKIIADKISVGTPAI